MLSPSRAPDRPGRPPRSRARRSCDREPARAARSAVAAHAADQRADDEEQNQTGDDGQHLQSFLRAAGLTEAKYIELRIQDSTGKLQPEFDVKLWQ